MFSPHFFIRSGNSFYWYLCFYLLSLPIYLLGSILLASIPINSSPDARGVALDVLSFGYVFLGIFSLIHTILYTRTTKNYFRGYTILFGSQILFWIIGSFLGNNYILLTCYFLLFLLYAVYMNLLALQIFLKPPKERKKKH